MKLFEKLFCKHDYQHVRNYHGERIIGHNWSEWKCSKCGNEKLKDGLHK